jgi:hypothetical protein
MMVNPAGQPLIAAEVISGAQPLDIVSAAVKCAIKSM